MKKPKINGFFTGAMILAAAGIICRLLGVVIRIPLTNIVGNFGMGLYQMVFPLYALLLIISSAGFPVAISKMVAAQRAAGLDNDQPRKILLNSVILLGFIGAIVSALFVVLSYQIAALQGNKDVGIIYIAIAPSVFLVCIISAFRGYFQGFQNMVPTATSQILEQLVKVGAGVTMAVLFAKISVVWAVFGAILAITISEALALLYLFAIYLWSLRKKKSAEATTFTEETRTPRRGEGVRSRPNSAVTKGKWLDRRVMWQITKQSVPITLMASVFPLILVLDSMLIINMLTSAGVAHKEATQLYGISSGAVHTLINLPAVLGVAIATAIVPAVSSLMKQNKYGELRDKMALAIKATFIIGIFFTAFYLVFADKILDLLYHGAFKDDQKHFKIATNLMRIESALILLIALSSVFTAMLQGAGKAKFPLIALAIGGAVKIAFQFSLIKTPLGIYAVSIGNVLCFAIAATLNTIFALRYIRIKRAVVGQAFRLVGLTVAFAVIIRLVDYFMPENRWWVLLSGVLAFGIYVILLAIFGILRLNNINVGNIFNRNKRRMKNETI